MYDRAPDASGELTETMGDMAFQVLRAAILAGDLTPGAEVSEQGLARAHQLGRGPVRIALARLREHGLVTAVPRRGYVVAPLTLRDVRDVFELRRLLEPAAAAQACGRVDPSELEGLSAMAATTDAAGRAAAMQALRQFQLAIANAAGNRRQARVMGELWDQTLRFLQLPGLADWKSFADPAPREAVIRALAGGEAQAAATAAAAWVDKQYRTVVDGVLASDSELRTAERPASA